MKIIYTFFILFFSISFINAQNNQFERFSILFGKWEGKGVGFSSTTSVIQSEFSPVMNNKYIEVKNHSEFEPTDKNPEGEIHDDRGMISFDRARKKYVFRQFHVEGFVNQYVLNDSLSNETTFVFESENIENFVPGGTARFTIKLLNSSEIETLFDIGMPGRRWCVTEPIALKNNRFLTSLILF